ncbi:hypothetical protein ACR6HW_12005 [Fusibacter sp. JL298sf-3]
MNTTFMKIVAYALVVGLFYKSHKSREKALNAVENDDNSKHLVAYIHSCELRLGILLFFIVVTLISMATHL